MQSDIHSHMSVPIKHLVLDALDACSSDLGELLGNVYETQ